MRNIELNTTWKDFLSEVRNQLPSDKVFDAWFSVVSPIALEDKCVSQDSQEYTVKVLTVEAPSEAFCKQLETKFSKPIAFSLRKVLGEHFKLQFQINNNSPKSQTSNKKKNLQNGNESLGRFKSNLNSRMTLDNFHESHCNRMVRSAAITIIENPGKSAFNPFFIHGASGVGKTHILHAIGNEALKLSPDLTVVYVPAQIFKMQYVEAAMKRKKPEEFIHFYQNIDILLIDDIQELTDAIATQHAFFQIFNNLKLLGKQIVITSDRPPIELHGLEERLFTRVKWGLTAQIERPDVTLRKKILEVMIQENELTIPEDVFRFIVMHADQNIRDIEGTLTSIMAHALMSKQAINLDLAHKIMSQTIGIEEKKLNIDRIIEVTCRKFNVTEEQVKGKSRIRQIVLARQSIMYLSKEYTDISLSEIGSKMGGKDHSTVIHATKTINNLIETDPKIRQQIEKLCEELNINTL